ncbi:MAG: DUF3256 family protein [Dysgonomonas sp.]
MKKIFLLFLFIIPAFCLHAQDVTSVFLSMPDDILLGLDAEGKDKLIAAPTENNDSVAVMTALRSEIKRLGISDDYIKLQTSKAGTMQIKLLPLVNNTKIICVVKTVCGKACDSYINFYSTDWVLLDDISLFPVPDKEWFIKPDADREDEDFANAYAALIINPFKIELSADDYTASVYYDIKNSLSADDWKKFEPYFTNQPKVFTWNKISFK